MIRRQHIAGICALVASAAVPLSGAAQQTAQVQAQKLQQSGKLLAQPAPAPEDNIRVEQISVLSAKDRDLYRQIFAAQERADWPEAERLIRRLDDRILVGQVLSDRYLGPRYRSSYPELLSWMRHYADLPSADRVYKLALSRKPKKAAAPPPPMPDAPPPPPPPAVHYSPAELARLRAIRTARANIQEALGKGQPAQAEKHLWAAGRKLFDKDSFGHLQARIASGYFYQGNDAKALALGAMGGATAGKGRFLGNWIAGLSAWRRNDCKEAANHFEKAAEAAGDDPWNASSAAFWAARARLACRQPDQVNLWLEQAARHQKTFYGLVAARQLGHDIQFSWDHPPLTRHDYDRLREQKATRRAIALWQVGQLDASDWELRYLWRRSDETLHPALLGLAARLDVPSTQIRLAKALDRKQILSSSSALFPVPAWAPQDGFKVDRALIFAFMRQESEFSARAVSSAGARGLMQLMPRTASYIGRDQSLQDRNGHRLDDPGFNMQLGQRYIEYLMQKPFLGSNLFFVAGAYNGGPGNLNRWKRDADFKNDPLLFLETIPATETRDYVEKVVANYWVYQVRMGQKIPTLDAVASGGWPIYNPQDKDM